jgi:hypothetical protein
LIKPLPLQSQDDEACIVIMAVDFCKSWEFVNNMMTKEARSNRASAAEFTLHHGMMCGLSILPPPDWRDCLM